MFGAASNVFHFDVSLNNPIYAFFLIIFYLIRTNQRDSQRARPTAGIPSPFCLTDLFRINISFDKKKVIIPAGIMPEKTKNAMNLT